MDEDMNPKIADLLREHGHDVLTVDEADRKGESDPSQFAYAQENNRIMVTHNADDYAELHRFKCDNHLGIVSAKKNRKTTPVEFAARINYVVTQVEDMQNNFARANKGNWSLEPKGKDKTFYKYPLDIDGGLSVNTVAELYKDR
ncbi:MAG: hypothetical protein GY804_12135 [Alphaproteobacteria bacterium]|nr:hypothetical protein [Alphaproteobacteria bacterium]